MSIQLSEATALVTGANRGLGASIVRALRARGVKKVYAAARNPADVPQIDGVVPVALDVTNPAQVQAVAKELGDVTLLINNAGISERGPLLDEDSLGRARRQMEVNYFGPLALTSALAPALRAHGSQAAVVNILSALAWVAPAQLAEYSASKAAAWALTNGTRTVFKPDGVQVVALHVGYMDTDMTAGVTAEKTSPDVVAEQIVDALEQGTPEVTADDVSRHVRSQLSAQPAVYLYGPDL